MSYADPTTAKRQKPPILQPYTRGDGELGQRLRVFLIVAAFALFCLPYGFFYALIAPYLFLQFAAPLAFLAIIMIWALPDMRRAPTALLAPGLFAFAAALFLWPNYLAITLPGLPWITMIRLTTFPLTFIFLLSLSISVEFRTKLFTILKATSPLWQAMVGFLIAYAISIVFSGNINQSVQSVLLKSTSWITIFFVSAYSFSKPGRIERFAVMLWVMAVILGVVGVIESRNYQVLWASHIPPFLKVEDEVVTRIISGAVRRATGQYRVQSTFSTALGLSEFCAMVMPFVIHFAAGAYKLQTRLLAIFTAPFLLYVIITTDARLGLLGFFLSLMIYLFLWGVLRWTKSRESLIGPATVLAYPVLFVITVALTFLVGRIKSKVWGSGQYAASNNARLDQWETGLPKMLDHPLGHGPDRAGVALGYTNPAGVMTIDSYILAIGIEIGLIGLVIYLATLIVPIFYSVKYSLTEPGRQGENRFLLPLAVTIVNFFAIKFVFANDDNHPLIFIVIGAVAALVYRVRRVVEPDFAEAKPRRVHVFHRPLFARRVG